MNDVLVLAVAVIVAATAAAAFAAFTIVISVWELFRTQSMIHTHTLSSLHFVNRQRRANDSRHKHNDFNSPPQMVNEVYHPDGWHLYSAVLKMRFIDKIAFHSLFLPTPLPPPLNTDILLCVCVCSLFIHMFVPVFVALKPENLISKPTNRMGIRLAFKFDSTIMNLSSDALKHNHFNNTQRESIKTITKSNLIRVRF